jgi:hypothetical protein
MNARAVDLKKLRAALRQMTRVNLLIIAERAIELVSRDKLQALVGNLVRLKDLAQTKPTAVRLLAEVRKFYEAGLQGRYYESFDVNSKNFMDTSEGTEEFTVEFNDLLGKCVHAAENEPRHPVREAFELLLGLLRRIDMGDDVIFFADEGGSYQIGVDWRVVLPAYFRCLASTAPPEDFAREADRTIKDFAEYERSRHLTAARRMASAEQKKALRSLPAIRGRRGAAHAR